ncbi:MAG: hypothetical protein IPI33_00480 [Dehalococcoidia bacterium]|nr:hypothetical protein [Dehalococcoidia bacterium]
MGLVTLLTGAARRTSATCSPGGGPLATILLSPALVQGEQAAGQGDRGLETTGEGTSPRPRNRRAWRRQRRKTSRLSTTSA